MYFYLIGIDHNTASIDARDAIYRNRKAITAFWERGIGRQASVIVTCNRIEIYGLTEDTAEAAERIDSFFENYPDFLRYSYVVHGKERVFRHALRVACGLESQIKGEPQILAQLRAWSSHKISHPLLKKLWEEVILYAGEIRRRAGLERILDNIAGIIFEDLTRRLKGKNPAKIAVIGTGKIAELIAESGQAYFYLNFVAHKNHQKAEVLAKISNGRASLLTDLPQIIREADAVISATSSPHYILRKENLADLSKKGGNPLYLYDLAVPRDVDPEIGGIEGVVLRNLDDLNTLFDGYNRRRQENIALASYLVDEKLKNYTGYIYEKGYQNRDAA